MKIKLTLVLSDITGKSGIRIIEAILAGERNPDKLADMADLQCKTPKGEIAKALEGNWEEDLVFVLRQNYDTFKHFCTQLDRCDTELEKLMENYRTEVAEAGGRHTVRQKNVVTTTNENEPWASMWKERHMTCGK